MVVHTSPEAFYTYASSLKKDGLRTGLVPTMGALHRGHLSLLDACSKACDISMVSIFVNPAQFNSKQDLESYPRQNEADLAMLEKAGADAVFLPDADLMYGPMHQTRIQVVDMEKPLCGASRPGHFAGVATVVCKLFMICQPDIAFFGEKDYQQLQLIRSMTRDLNIPVLIQGCPTVRDEDGLAMSSRNRLLSPAQREAALVIPGCVNAAVQLHNQGADGHTIVAHVKKLIEAVSEAKLDYIELVHPETLLPLAHTAQGAILAIAAYFGSVRLIDNVYLLPLN